MRGDLRLKVPKAGGVSTSIGLDFAACSGNVTTNLDSVDGGAAGALAEGKQQLDRLGPSTRWVSLTVGGNDVGFADVLTACPAFVVRNTKRGREKFSLVVGLDGKSPYDTSKSRTDSEGNLVGLSCDDQLANAEALIAGGTVLSPYDGTTAEPIVARLKKVYRTIMVRASNAQLAVATYPQLFPKDFEGIQLLDSANPSMYESAKVCRVAHLAQALTGKAIHVPDVHTAGGVEVGYFGETVSRFNAIEIQLNRAIKTAVAELQQEGWNRVRVADLASDTSHPIDCGPRDDVNPYINGVRIALTPSPNATPLPDNVHPFGYIASSSFHPTAAAHRAFATLVGSALAKPGAVAPTITEPSGVVNAETGTPFTIPLVIVGGTPTDELGNPFYTWGLATTPPPANSFGFDGNNLVGTVTSSGTWPLTLDLFGPTGVVATKNFTLVTASSSPQPSAVRRASGPAGFVSYATGIVCPPAASGHTMWIVPRGAGQSAADVDHAVPYASSHGGISVYTTNDAPPGVTSATAACAENSNSGSAAGAVPTKTYSFSQLVTGPTHTLSVTSAPDPNFPGPRYSISPNGGCGTEENGSNGLQNVNIFVYDTTGHTLAAVLTGRSTDGAGDWQPATFNFPSGAGEWGVFVSCGATVSNDQSEYIYPLTRVPVP